MLERFSHKFVDFIRKNFPGGIAPASIIDRKKFARLLDEPFPDNDEDYEAALARLVNATCVQVGKKFYAVSPEFGQNLKSILGKLKSKGVCHVYYDVFFARHADRLRAWGVMSPKILAACVQKYFSFAGEDDFFRLQDAETLISELMRLCSDRLLLTQDELAALCPFIPQEIAANALVASGNFCQLKSGQLFSAANLKFEENEFANLAAHVRNEVKTQGYIPVKELAFPYTQEIYPDVPREGLLCAFEEKLQPYGLEKYGQFIKSKNGMHITGLIKQFCRERDEFSLDQLKEVFGEAVISLRHLPELLQKTVGQISKDRFVSLELLEFDVEKTDCTIKELSKNKPFSLLSFDSLNLLPPIPHYVWNHYVLQSYFFHTSKVFKIVRPAPNNACIAIVYMPATVSNIDYQKLAASIAVNNGVVPTVDILCKFLHEKGLYGNIRSSTVNSIIQHMLSSV